jgi:release factor glutamine methyltransferase
VVTTSHVTLQEALERLYKALRHEGIPDARLEAELLLAHTTSLSRAHLHVYPERELTSQQRGSLEAFLERRLRREPLAYILERKEFFGLEFAVRPGVMIPRPETELLVERALILARQLAEGGRAPRVADIGTGCGNIAISLAVNVPGLHVYGVDSSSPALSVARENVRRHRVSDRITLLPGDLLTPLPERVDIIAANLPYVRRNALPLLQPEVRWEPAEALDGGPDGLDVLRRLLEQAPRKLCRGGYVLMEMDPDEREPLSREALARLPGATLEVCKDLAGHERLLVARTPREG